MQTILFESEKILGIPLRKIWYLQSADFGKFDTHTPFCVKVLDRNILP
jgi:hypothetical protein